MKTNHNTQIVTDYQDNKRYLRQTLGVREGQEAKKSSDLPGMPELVLSKEPIVDGYMKLSDGDIKDLQDPRVLDYLKDRKIPSGWTEWKDPVLEQHGYKNDKQIVTVATCGGDEISLETFVTIDNTTVRHSLIDDYDAVTEQLVGQVNKYLELTKPLDAPPPENPTTRILEQMEPWQSDWCEIGGAVFEVQSNATFDGPFLFASPAGVVDDGGKERRVEPDLMIQNNGVTGHSRQFGHCNRGQYFGPGFIKETNLEADGSFACSITIPDANRTGTLTQTLKTQLGDWRNVTKVFTYNPNVAWPPKLNSGEQADSA